MAGMCPYTLTPWSPYYQDRRKETESYLKSDGQCPDGTWRAGCFRRVPKPVSQQNGQIWGPDLGPEGPSPARTPPPTGGGKINTEFTKSGPVISPTAEKELFTEQQKPARTARDPPAALPQGTRIPLQLGPPGQKGADSVSY